MRRLASQSLFSDWGSNLQQGDITGICPSQRFERSRKRQAEPEREWMTEAVWASAGLVCGSS